MSAHSFEVQGHHCPFIPVFGAPQVMFERGLGTELWDTDGKRYLDFLGGLAVTALGHSNPVIAAAICEQASTLMHVSNLFANPARWLHWPPPGSRPSTNRSSQCPMASVTWRSATSMRSSLQSTQR